MAQYTWTLQTFDNLANKQLYAILKLRCEVFIVEQACNYQDIDGKDLKSFHLCGWDGENLVAYARLLPAGTSFAEVSIGRVLSSPAYRRKAAGIELMQNAIKLCIEKFGKQPIRIGAQLYLQKFYSSFGFEKDSDVYLEDDIEHIEMILL
jgi:ElaA protein